MGNLISKALPGVGICRLPGCGGENRTGSVRFQIIFFSDPAVPHSYKHVFRLDTAFVSNWLPKKGLQKLCRMFEGAYEK